MLVRDFFDQTVNLYNECKDKYHMGYWKETHLSDEEDEKMVEVYSKYLDKCKIYIEENDIQDDNYNALLPIVYRVLKKDKEWKSGEFDPKKIISVFTNIRNQFNEQLKNNPMNIDDELVACVETARYFTKSDDIFD